MRIDPKAVEQARNTDLISFFERHCGFTFTQHCSVYRCKQHQSLAVKDDRLSWFWHSKGVGGYGVLDYLIKVENMPFRKAVETVVDISLTEIQPRSEIQLPKQERSETLILPEKAILPTRLYNYLCQKRGIDSAIVKTLIQEEKLYEDRRGNVVFVGYDDCGKARFASLRGTYGDCSFRMDCAGSDKRYSFNMSFAPSELVDSEVSKRLYIYESPIDAMSHASLEILATGDKDAWKRQNRLSLAGTSDTALMFFLKKRSVFQHLIFCLDNDNAGRDATKVMVQKYAKMGYHTQIELPMGKDFNENLQALVKRIQAQKRTFFQH